MTCERCKAEGADCLTRERVRVCESCLCEDLQRRVDDLLVSRRRLCVALDRVRAERDEARAECDALRERQAMVRAFDPGRDERCASCGRPTYAGEDFDGPCVHESDLECALARVKEEAERVTAALDERNVARSERDEARAEVERLKRPAEATESARAYARRRGALDGANAQALEGALTLTERERDEARAEVERLRGLVASIHGAP